MIPQLIRDSKRIKAGNQLRKRWWRYNMDALHLKYGEFWPKGMTVVDGDEYPPCMPQRDRVKDLRSWIKGNRRGRDEDVPADGSQPFVIRALMMCDPNYRDAILKALRRLERVPATAIKDNQEADPNGEEKDG